MSATHSAPPVPQEIGLVREEDCSVAAARRVAAMLDVPTQGLTRGAPLPRGWHFLMLAADTPKHALRDDGFPGLGVPMPDLGLPRLMLGGRSVRVVQDMPLGSAITRRSRVQQVTQKTCSSGPMAVVKLLHTLHLGASQDPALLESQTYLLFQARQAPRASDTTLPQPIASAHATNALPPNAPHRRVVRPDDTLLLQFSALGFNTHRIHWDRHHAKHVEGFPDLVVNGGLVTLLMTEFLRLDMGLTPAAYTVQHLAPLFVDRAITLVADRRSAAWHVGAYDEQNRLAVDMEVTIA